MASLDALLGGVDEHLAEGGTFQMVTMAPGDEREPFMLYDLVGKHLPNREVEVVLDLAPITYDGFVGRFVDIFGQDPDAIERMKRTAQGDGVTHLHLLVLRYKKGKLGGLQVKHSQKTYETWSSPLGAAVSMAELMHQS